MSVTKQRRNKEFRERAFRGAKIEDTIWYFKRLAEDLKEQAISADAQRRMVYEAQALCYSNTVVRLMEEFGYSKEYLDKITSDYNKISQ